VNRNLQKNTQQTMVMLTTDAMESLDFRRLYCKAYGAHTSS